MLEHVQDQGLGGGKSPGGGDVQVGQEHEEQVGVAPELDADNHPGQRSMYNWMKYELWVKASKYKAI